MLRAYVGVAIVSVIPGLIVAQLLGLTLRSLRTWAAIPAFSLASVFLVAEIADLVHVPFGLPAVAIVVAILGAIAIVQARAARPIDAAGEPPEPARRDMAAVIAVVLLVAGIGVGLFTWLHGINGHGVVPPGTDAANHGFFVARILHTNSIDVAKIAVSDSNGFHPSVSYYPLAMHASAAVAQQLTGADIGRVLVALTVLFSAVVLPLGMFVVARTLAPKWPLVAGFTALIVPSLALFPYGTIQFGDIPIIVGMALVPITVVLLTDAIIPETTAFSWSALVGAALALLTAIVVHSSQAPLIVVLTALLSLERAWLHRSTQMLGRATLRGLGVSALAGVLLAPSLVSFASGVSERSGYDNARPRALGAAIGPVFGLDSAAFQHPARQWLLALLAAAGVVLWLLHRRFAWVVGYILVLAVMLLAAVSDSPLSKAISLPWYRGPGRVGWNRAFFVPFFAGLVLALGVTAIVRLRKGGDRALVVVTVCAVAVFGAAIGYRGYQESSAMVRYSFATNSRVTPASQAAFAWLAGHVARGDVVVNDVNVQGVTTDGALWMYAQRGLHPLFGFDLQLTKAGFSAADNKTVSDWNSRFSLLRSLPRLGSDARITDLAQRYHARWVYFDERVIFPFHHTMTLAGLERNARLRQVFRAGTVHVFEIVEGRPQ